MQLLHESTVLPEEIDSLGHMNVRYYMARMERANAVLIEGLGLDEHTLAASFLRRVDTYTRFQREQFEGAPLHTQGGILNVSEGGMQSYIQIQNPDTQDVAATFIATTALIQRATRTQRPFPIQPNKPQQSTWIELPDYAHPRSLSLEPVNTQVRLQELDDCLPDVESTGMMSGKRVATIDQTDVDADGWLREDIELMFLPFAKMVQTENTQHGPPVFQTGSGQRVGWAVMETRNILYAQPRLGDEIAYFSADLRLQEKSRLSRRWAFKKETGELLGISDSVGLCIDLDARRAIEWPQEIRAQIEPLLQPHLA